MFSKLVPRVCASIAALAFSIAPLNASALPTGTKAKIPFDFVVSGREMPAGEYGFDVRAGTSVVLLKGDHGRQALVFLSRQVIPTRNLTDLRVVFEKRQGKFVLREIRFADPSGEPKK
jgi:hypothetical protein